MTRWNSPPLDMPSDNEEVYVRLQNWFGQPFLAKYFADTQTFTDSVNGMIFPWWTVARWRSV